MSHNSVLEEALAYRRRYTGVIGVNSKVPVKDSSVLSVVYTPGVAAPCLQIAKHPLDSFKYTIRGNTVAIVSDGSAAFGLGNVGPDAILPVLESKAVIFKTFAGVDALPIVLNTQDTYEIIETIIHLAPTFGAICLEDISSPRSMTIGSHLEQAMTIPVVNNHRENAAIGVVAGLLNALKVVDKKPENVKIVINGAGAAGIGTAQLLTAMGFKRIIVCDRHGAIYKFRPIDMNWAKWTVSKITNLDLVEGALEEMLKDADVFIGFAAKTTLSGKVIEQMADKPIIFAFGGPGPHEPEITPEKAKAAGAAVVSTALSTYPNQMELASIFPGVFRGLLDVRARQFSIEMAIAAVHALADVVKDDVHADYIIPKVLDFRTAPAVASAIARAANEHGQSRVEADPDEIATRTRRYVYEGRLPVRPRDPNNGGKSLGEQSLELHERYQGVLEVKNKIPVRDDYNLNLFYLLPGALEPARAILKDAEETFRLTARGNLVAVVSDGSAVLGLGNIGARAAMPVMEGKAVLFNTFAGVEAFPICVATQDQDEIVDLVKRLEPTFGGINLEDISAPRCFYIEDRLKKETNIPIFHDDQHGTAIVVLAGMTNACKLLGRKMKDLRIVVNGAGASAIAVSKLLLKEGVPDLLRYAGHPLPGPHRKYELDQKADGPQDQQGEPARHVGRCDEGRGRAHRVVGGWRGFTHDGQVDGEEANYFRAGEPHTRDHAR
jgi:malate dehydrogenase (oxaloacetate-decarboxylating)